MPPRVIAALANLPHREGPVFRWETKRDKEGRVRRVSTYADRERRSGGHIRTGFAGAVARAALDPEYTPHRGCLGNIAAGVTLGDSESA